MLDQLGAQWEQAAKREDDLERRYLDFDPEVSALDLLTAREENARASTLYLRAARAASDLAEG
jgi:hypothetical protein